MTAPLQPVVLAGGSGTRLWPLSRALRPKQFLALAGDQTLLQRTLLRLQGLPCAPALVVCGEAQRFMAAEQARAISMTDARILLEPAPRNTAPALALAALLATQAGADPILLALPADHAIADVAAFQNALTAAVALARQGLLVTLGVPPTHAATGYGYIQRGAVLDNGWRVRRFVEKPDAARAAEYLAAGDWYWNSGVFVLGARRYLAELGRWRPDLLHCCEEAAAHITPDGAFLRPDAAAFARCASESIDYAVMEHTDRAAVVPLDAGWSDLGTWDTLLAVSPPDADGNRAHGDTLAIAAHDNLLYADQGLVAAVGVHDLLVVVTDDAVLVADRKAPQEVRTVVQRLQDQGRAEARQHRRVDRPWGSYEALARGPLYQVKRLVINPGAAISLQRHHQRAEHWVVVRGTAQVTRGEHALTLHANQSIDIPMGCVHRLANAGSEPLEVIEVQSGAYLGEDDIERLEDRYGRAGAQPS